MPRFGENGSYFGPDHPPNEAECIFRKLLGRRLAQPGNTDPRIWSIDPAGADVDLCVADALDVIERDGLPWFAELSVLPNALNLVETSIEDSPGLNTTWGYGNPGSPMRNHAIAYLRKALSTA